MNTVKSTEGKLMTFKLNWCCLVGLMVRIMIMFWVVMSFKWPFGGNLWDS